MFFQRLLATFFGISLTVPAWGHTKFADPDFAGDPAKKGTLKLRNPSDGLKNVNNPCGAPPTANEADRTVLVAGSKFRVVFWETIDHRSKYRIGFSADATDNFSVTLMDPDQIDNRAVHPESLPNAQDINGAVADRNNDPRAYTFEIDVPTTPCDQCALQLTQRMFPQLNANQVGDYATTDYFSCADIKIVPQQEAVAPTAPTNLRITIEDKAGGQ